MARKFNTNDVVTLRIEHSRYVNPGEKIVGTLMFLPNGVKTGNIFHDAGSGVVRDYDFLIVGTKGKDYVVLIDDIIDDEDVNQFLVVDEYFCDTWSIDRKYLDRKICGITDAYVVRKNTLATYERYQHSTFEKGATCRGMCGAHNEYANPDGKDDGKSYVCYSCKKRYLSLGLSEDGTVIAEDRTDYVFSEMSGCDDQSQEDGADEDDPQTIRC